MLTFLHAADVHLDSPLKGLERYEGAPVDQMRHATRRALENLVQVAIERSVAFVLIAGDLYDGDWRDFHTGLFFRTQMLKLREAAIPVFMVAGNHDAANKMTKRLPLPDNVQLLAHQRPETATLDDAGVAIHGQSFARGAVLDNLAAGYPDRRQGMFNIGLLHTCAEGREGHEPYAPCSLDDLRARQYDYWALGHVHKREVLSHDPPIVFPGNLQGRHVRETGPKGCMLVTVDDHHHASAQFHALDVLRWEAVTLDVSGLAAVHDVLDQAGTVLEQTADRADGRPVAVRVEMVGSSGLHRRLVAEPHRLTNEIRAMAQEVAGGSVWVEKIVQNTAAPTVQDPSIVRDGPIDELIRHIQELKADPGAMVLLAGQVADLVAKLPPELKDQTESLPLSQPEGLRATLDEVEQLLVHRLLARDET